MVVHVGWVSPDNFCLLVKFNCEDLWGHIVFQIFLTIGTQPVNVIDLFCDLGDCDLSDLGDLGTVDL